MKAIVYQTGRRELIDVEFNENQQQLFDALESDLNKPVYQSFVYRQDGRTTFICHYANLIATEQRRNVIIVCNDPDPISQIFFKLTSDNPLIESRSKKVFTYVYGTTVTFIKTNARMDGYCISDTDVFFDQPDLQFDTSCLHFRSRLRLI